MDRQLAHAVMLDPDDPSGLLIGLRRGAPSFR